MLPGWGLEKSGDVWGEKLASKQSGKKADNVIAGGNDPAGGLADVVEGLCHGGRAVGAGHDLGPIHGFSAGIR